MICECSCGWRGVPTFEGGRRVGRPLRHFANVRRPGVGPAGFRVVGGRAVKVCPACRRIWKKLRRAS